MENDKWYEVDIPLDEVKRILSANLKEMSRSFIAAGYYMKYIRDKKLYLQDGYSSIWKFAESQYGIQKSTASRWMAMNDRFSRDGNSPILADEYKSFNKSQLQEMLYLNSDQIKALEPEMSAKEIRAIRKPKKETVAPAQPERKISACIHRPEYICTLNEAQKGTAGDGENCSERCCWNCPHHGTCGYEFNSSAHRPEQKTEKEIKMEKCITGESGSGYCGAAAYCGEEYKCCNQCDKMCNSYCGWITEESRSEKPDERAAKKQQDTERRCEKAAEAIEIPDKKQREFEAWPPDLSDIPVPSLIAVKDLLEEQERSLKEYLACDGLPAMTVLKEQLITGGLRIIRNLVEDALEIDEEEPEEQTQPEIPFLKNNDQRKEWLRNYKSWGLWYEDKNIGARYYKYDFKNGARLIVETYMNPQNGYTPEFESSYFHLVGGPEPSKGTYGYGKWTRHEVYNRYQNNETELVEFLKELQRGD